MRETILTYTQFKGGHPGTVMGAAAIGVALWRYQMRYNPKNPDWFNRDRFVLSAGHACLWQYIHLHLAGYDAWTIDALKQYHNPDFGVSLPCIPRFKIRSIHFRTDRRRSP